MSYETFKIPLMLSSLPYLSITLVSVYSALLDEGYLLFTVVLPLLLL